MARASSEPYMTTAVDQASAPYLGGIEGFYGRSWSLHDRLAVIESIASMAYCAYVYAPKSDRKLRSDWRSCWDDDELSKLHQIAAHCQQHNIAFGVGLSPLGLHDLSTVKERQALQDKLAQIQQLNPDVLCILFDDMSAVGDDLANTQLAIVEFVSNYFGEIKIIVCPSYYSTDSVLEKVFGSVPKNYWKTLGKGLDSRIDFFWTGEQVCSKSFSRANLDFIASEFQREAVLWDNYPVNDGERLSQFLNLMPFEGREPWLSRYTAGHFANPMNQPYLSLPPLATLPIVYTVKDSAKRQDAAVSVWEDYLAGHAADCAQALITDAQVFQQQGLNGLSVSDKNKMLGRYREFSSPYANEVVEWLSGRYQFDPACLTD